METSPPPVKKLRAMQLTECVREFTLPQQYPSMVTSKEKSVVLKSKNNISESNVANITNISNITNLAATKSVQLLPSTNTQGGNNLQKLRIKLPNGKDLGEFNVQLLPQKSNILMKKPIFIKQDAFKNMNKPLAWSTISAEDNIIQRPCKSPLDTVNQTTGKHIDENRIVVNISHPPKPQKDDAENKGIIMRNKPLILARKGTSVSKRIHESKEARIDASTSNLQNQQYIVQMNSQNELTNASKLKNVIPKFVKLPTDTHAPKLFIMGNSKSNSKAEQPCMVSDIESSKTDTKSVKEQKIINSTPLLIKQDKKHLSIAKSSKDTCQIPQNSKENETSQIAPCKENNKMPLTSTNDTLNINMEREQNEEEGNPSVNKNCIDVLPRSSGTSQEAAGNSTANKGKLGKNVMVIVHDNRSDLLQRNTNVSVQNLSQKSNRTIVSSNSCKRLENSCISKDKEIINHNKNINNNQLQETQSHSEKPDEGSNSVPSFRTNSSEEDLIERRNILEKALNSVQDEDLRMQALKALAACGIITERYVSKQPPSDKKLVHDTEVQTVVFGILEEGSFISVSEKEANIRRIPLKEQPAVNSGIDSLCEPLIRDTYMPTQDDDLNDCLSILAKHFLKDNEGAYQIKEVLTKPNHKSVNIANHLQKDFETALQYNEEGTLNIHRAVIEGRIHDVRRHLMILKGRNESIDIKTDDGMTSLELALTYGASADIVYLLLETGAQPALEEAAHESAILIASKKSLPQLTLLLRYVTNKRSLDMLDSMGFSALHYCALNGDLDGVKALISSGADVNLKDGRSGRTALFHAVEQKRFTVAQKLLDNGAIANIPNFSGQTVLSLVDEIKNLSFRTSLTKAVK